MIEEDGTVTFKTVAIVEGDEVQPFNAFSPSGNVMVGTKHGLLHFTC